MAQSTRVAGLHLELGLRTREFRQNLRRSRREISRASRQIGQDFKSIATVTATAVAAVTASLSLITRAAVRTQLEIARGATNARISARTFQGLSVIYRSVGLDIRGLSTTFIDLADRLQEARDGTKSYIDDFRLLGLEVDDFNDLTIEESFFLFLERLERAEDPVKATAAATRLLTTEGEGLAEVLKTLNGADGVRALVDRFEDLGGVLSEESTNALRRLNLELNLAASIASSRFAQGFVEGLGGASNNLTAFQDILEQVSDAAFNLGNAFGSFLEELRTNEDILRNVGSALVIIVGAWAALKALGIGAALLRISTNLASLAITVGTTIPGFIALAGAATVVLVALEDLRNFLGDLAMGTQLAALQELELNAAQALQRSLDETVAQIGEATGELDTLRGRLDTVNRAIEEGSLTQSEITDHLQDQSDLLDEISRKEGEIARLNQRAREEQERVQAKLDSAQNLNIRRESNTLSIANRVRETVEGIGDAVLGGTNDLVNNLTGIDFGELFSSIQEGVEESIVAGATAGTQVAASQVEGIFRSPRLQPEGGIENPLGNITANFDQSLLEIADRANSFGARLQESLFGENFGVTIRDQFNASLEHAFTEGSFTSLADTIRDSFIAALNRGFAQRLTDLLGNIFNSIVNNLAGRSNPVLSNIGSFLGAFGGGGVSVRHEGTPFVPRDEIAFLQRGEAVIPRELNRPNLFSGGGDTYNFNPVIDGDMTPRSRRLLDEYAVEFADRVTEIQRNRGVF